MDSKAFRESQQQPEDDKEENKEAEDGQEPNPKLPEPILTSESRPLIEMLFPEFQLEAALKSPETKEAPNGGDFGGFLKVILE